MIDEKPIEDMDRLDWKKRYAYYFVRLPREIANISRPKLAEMIYSSVKTIQNWEEAKSAPSDEQAHTICRVCGVSYSYLNTLYCHPGLPEMHKASVKEKRKRLTDIINNELTDAEINDLAFIMDGPHGSDRYLYLQKAEVDLLTTLQMRNSTLAVILNNYKIAKATGQIENENVIPDIESLEHAAHISMQAIAEGKNTYTK